MKALAARQREARLWFYGIVAASFIPFVILALAAERFDFRLLAIAVAASLALIIAFEAVILLARTRPAAIRSDASLKELLVGLGGLPRLITGATAVDILAGVGDEVAEESVIRVLAAAGSANVRILLLHPGDVGAQTELYCRQLRDASVPDDRVDGEIERSRARIAAGLGPRTARDLRLYRIPRPFSLYRSDRKLVLAANSFGHGSSSPALYIEWDAGTEGFCRKLLSRFEEVWELAEPVNAQGLLQPRPLPAAPQPLRRPVQDQGIG